MAAMTPRQRMLAAIANQIPDRVPVAPDISNMVPTRLTGRGYLAVYAHEDPPLWRAYIDAVRHYGMDGWFTYGQINMQGGDVAWSEKWLEQSDEQMVKEMTVATPDGPITQKLLYRSDQPPILVEKFIKDVDRDWPRFRHLWGPVTGSDPAPLEIQRAALGELGVLGVCSIAPGFAAWQDHFEGGIEALSYLSMDRPELLDEMRDLHHQRLMAELEHIVAARPDFVLTGGSGSITLASPDLWRTYALPTIQAQCAYCADHGVATMIHSCGKSRVMVETCARETKLNCINPLEIPPMGDITLAEAKQMVAGSALALMGNLHTTEVMLRGNPDQVREAARQAIADAGAGGGFILSTGDQCGWGTPDENLFALVAAAQEFGQY